MKSARRAGRASAPRGTEARLAKIARECERLSGIDSVRFLLFEAPGPADGVKGRGRVGPDVEAGRAPTGELGATAKGPHAPGPRPEAPEVPPALPPVPEDVPRDWLRLPLRQQGHQVGIMSLGSRREEGLSHDAVLAAMAFAGQAELALEAAHLRSSVERARTAERVRLSREIHDEIGQILTAVKISLELLAEDLPAHDDGAKTRVAGTTAAVQRALHEVRRIAHGLRPRALDALDLPAALHAHVDSFSALTGISVALTMDGNPGCLSDEAQALLYRVAQEALSNVARHAGSARASCRLRFDEDLVTLTIADEGQGFDPSALSGPDSGGLGLRGIRERVAALGGALTVTAAPGHGTVLVVELRADGRAAPESSRHRPQSSG